MKESRLQRYMDFISFNLESEGYRMTAQAEQYVERVLEDDLSGDEAVSEIVDSFGLASESDTSVSPDGCYEGTDVCINYYGIRDQELLDEIETYIVAVRMAQIMIGPQEWNYNFDHLKSIHGTLFGDIYPFAGEIRYIPITRRTMFCLPNYIQRVADEIFETLRKDHYLRGQEHEDFINNLAYFMAEIHALHPFMDGNTRTMRVFFHQLCQAAGWNFDLASASDKRLLEADIAALEGDYQPLIGILNEVVKPLH
ncbi:MAG: Fic family protein [Sphaerochaetaceae bacterium]|jgi:cell filamentation protein|nr:Fic family protein [Sphaerochaetaceae bacterium]NLV83721.1 cell filamentation protein Fic [Spirochaetales bacterium]